MTLARLVVHQLRFEQLVFWRNRPAVFFTFVFPVILLAIGVAGDREHREFLVPGIMAFALLGVCFQGLAISLAMQRDQGVLKRLRATPMSGGALMVSKVVTTASIAAFEVVFIAVVGWAAFGIGTPRSPLGLVLACVMAGVAFSILGIALAACVRNGDNAPAIANSVSLPMMLVSGIFFGVDSLPDWLGDVGRALPLYHVATPIRSAYLDGWPPHLATHLGWITVWTALGVVIVLRRFRWMPAT